LCQFRLVESKRPALDGNTAIADIQARPMAAHPCSVVVAGLCHSSMRPLPAKRGGSPGSDPDSRCRTARALMMEGSAA